MVEKTMNSSEYDLYAGAGPFETDIADSITRLWNRTKERIDKLSVLPDGWYDGYGSKIDPDCIKHALRLCDLLHEDDADVPSAFPTPNGRVVLEWDKKEVEICPDGTLEWMAWFEDNDGYEHYISHIDDHKALKEVTNGEES